MVFSGLQLIARNIALADRALERRTLWTAALSTFALLASGTQAEWPIPTGQTLLMEVRPEVYWRESISGGPGKDGIPSIDRPRFISAEKADEDLDEEDIVMGVYHRGKARAYPQSILVWHEIVNDTIAGTNIAVTYCPLTGTGMGFLRGDTELGVSGRLVNSNMLMYDRATDTHWPQIVATGVHGPLMGHSLEEIRVVWSTWQRWQDRHPNTDVLSERTGHARNYRRDPYGSYNPTGGYYAERSRPIMPVMNTPPRRSYPPKRVIFGFRTATEAVAVDKQVLAREGILRYQGEGHDFLIIHDADLDTAWVLRSNQGGLPREMNINDLHFTPDGPAGKALRGLTPVNGFEAFWFAWFAFYPNTVLVDG